MRTRRKRNGWKVDSNDQLVGGKVCVAIWRVSGEPMKICERNFTFAIWAAHAHDRVERSECDAHIARVSSDALLTLPENRVNTIVTIKRTAAASGLAFVACRKCRVVKIIAARALQKIAAHRRHIAQLRACA